MQNLMPPVNTPDKLFHDGDPTQGIEGTIVTAQWLNDSQGATRDAQQELINVLAGAKISPDKSKQNQLLTAIQTLISEAVNAAKYVPDVGELFITSKKINPNTKYPGTTWVYLGEGLNLRTGKADGSDVGSITGADSVTLSAANLPAHNHTIGGTTGNSTAANANTTPIDFGQIGTSGAGSHSHSVSGSTTGAGAHSHHVGFNRPSNLNTLYGNTGVANAGNAVAAGGSQVAEAPNTNTVGDHAHNLSGSTNAVGDHAHTISLPSHYHTVTIPAHNHALPASTGSVGSGSSFSVVAKSKLVMVWERTA
ncbi:hypothetical protein [Enterobacter asburiae]|uniref:hypothetical protein n=1 Tax=Enterobacter asburiae TaxID=61645 RepID=UPI003EE6C65F